MLADDDDAVHRELLAPQRHGAGDAVVDREVVLLGEGPAHVVFGELIDVHRHEAQVRKGLAVVVIALEDLADDDVGVGVPAILGDDGGDALGFGHEYFSPLPSGGEGPGVRGQGVQKRKVYTRIRLIPTFSRRA